ncbi:unnamed protein product [Victoria cruziana]
MELSVPSSSSAPSALIFKNRLQEYAQKLGLPLPSYQTINEGFTHAPLFKATVIVGGETYRSQHAFKHRKSAEQDVARLALESLSKKMEVEGKQMISEERLLCKSILNEFMVKMNMEKPLYTTVVQTAGLLPMFVSSVLFNGVTYTGNAARSKKEAEQLAARKVIQTILGQACNSSDKNLLVKIIKSKSRLYDSTDRDATYSENHKRVSVDSVTDPLPSHVVVLKKLKVENGSEMADPTNEVHAPNQAASLSIREPEDKGNNLQLLGVNAGGPDAASSDNCSQEKPLVDHV